MADDQDEFHATDSGASETFPMQCSSLRKNGFVILKDKPCKIVEMTTSKTGKHGHAKVHMVGIDIFTNKKLEDICPSTHNMNVPNVTRQEYTCVDIDNGFLTLMDESGETREDLKLPEGPIGDEIVEKHGNSEDFMVTVLKAMGQEQVIATKNATK